MSLTVFEGWTRPFLVLALFLGLELTTNLVIETHLFRWRRRCLAGRLARGVSKGSPAETVYDGLMLPALNYAEHDRIKARLSPEEEQRVIEATRELLPEGPGPGERGASGEAAAASSVALLGYPANGDADAVALRMLARVLEGTPIVLDILPGPPLWSELVELVKTKGYRYRTSS